MENKVIAQKPRTSSELWKRVEEEWTKSTRERCEKLVMSCGRSCAQVIQSKRLYTFYLFLTAATHKNVSCNLLSCYSGYSALILISVFHIIKVFGDVLWNVLVKQWRSYRYAVYTGPDLCLATIICLFSVESYLVFPIIMENISMSSINLIFLPQGNMTQ